MVWSKVHIDLFMGRQEEVTFKKMRIDKVIKKISIILNFQNSKEVCMRTSIFNTTVFAKILRSM